MIVDVSHPAALLHVPRGARKERLEFRAVSTPAEIREIPDGAFRFAGRLPRIRFEDCDHDLFEHGGALWTRLEGWQSEGLPADQIGMPFGREAFLRFLAGDPPGRFDYWYPATDLAHAFARTPLEARYEIGPGGAPLFRAEDEHARPHLIRTGTTRGAAIDPATSRRVALDDAANARAAATRFVGERLAFSGDTVMFRLATPVARAHCDPGLKDAGLYDARAFPYAEGGGGQPGLLARPDLVAAHAAATQPRAEPRLTARLSTLVSALEGLEPNDGDLEAFANLVPQRMVRIANEALGEHYMDAARPGSREALLARARPFELWAIRAMTGGVPATEAAYMADEVLAYLALAEAVRPRSQALYELRRLAAHAEGYVLARRHAPGPDDEEALSGLSAPQAG